MKRILYIIVICLTAFACRSEKIDDPQIITVRTAAISRATGQAFDEGDKVGIWFLNKDTAFESASGNYTDNSEWNYTKASLMSAEEIRYPKDKQGVDFYAYYPYDGQAASTPTITAYPFTVKIDQSLHADYSASDFMYCSGSGETAANAPIDLLFKHKLSRIELNIKLGKEMHGVWPEVSEVTISSVATQTTIDLTTGDAAFVSGGGNGKVVANLLKEFGSDGTTLKTLTAQAIVAPQDIASGSDFLTLSTPLYDYKTVTTTPITLAAGASYRLNVTLHDKVLIIESITLEDWKEGETESGDLTRATVHDFTRLDLDFSQTGMYMCYDLDMDVIAVVCKEYIPSLKDTFTIVYPVTDDTKQIYPKEGYIISSGQKVSFSKIGNTTICTVGDAPTNFSGVYRSIEGIFMFTAESYLLADPVCSPYLFTDARGISPYGFDEKAQNETFSYGVVKIGTQLWMTENLKTSKLNNGCGLRIGKIGNSPSTTPKPDNWYGWFGRNYPGCILYGDGGDGIYGKRDADGQFAATRNKYGMLYNYHAVNAENEPTLSIPPHLMSTEFVLATSEFTLPSNQDWYNMVSYLQPVNIAAGNSFTGEGTYTGLCEILEKAGFNPLYGGHLEYVPGAKLLTQNFVSQGIQASFWSKDAGVVDDTTPQNNTAWVWGTTGTPTAPSTTEPDFCSTKRFIREGHAVRLMGNIPIEQSR